MQGKGVGLEIKAGHDVVPFLVEGYQVLALFLCVYLYMFLIFSVSCVKTCLLSMEVFRQWPRTNSAFHQMLGKRERAKEGRTFTSSVQIVWRQLKMGG